MIERNAILLCRRSPRQSTGDPSPVEFYLLSFIFVTVKIIYSAPLRPASRRAIGRTIRAQLANCFYHSDCSSQHISYWLFRGGTAVRMWFTLIAPALFGHHQSSGPTDSRFSIYCASNVRPLSRSILHLYPLFIYKIWNLKIYKLKNSKLGVK